MNPRLTVSMPYWRSQDYVRRSVEGVLNQTFTDLRLVVVNDGDPQDAWEPLADIDDPRLVRFDLDVNRGRYWADAVTLAACDTEWWTPHDSDDVSLPDRFEKLLEAIDMREAVFSPVKMVATNGEEVYLEVRPDRLVPPRIGTIAKYPAGLYRTESAQAIGGPHPEVRGSYDTTFVSLMWNAFHPLPVVDEYLYVVHKRAHSLTTHRDTHMGSSWRQRQRKIRRLLYQRAIAYPVGKWADVLRPSREVQAHLQEDVRRLRALLGGSENGTKENENQQGSSASATTRGQMARQEEGAQQAQGPREG